MCVCVPHVCISSCCAFGVVQKFEVLATMLKNLARTCDLLILWLDCDREGEAIGQRQQREERKRAPDVIHRRRHDEHLHPPFAQTFFLLSCVACLLLLFSCRLRGSGSVSSSQPASQCEASAFFGSYSEVSRRRRARLTSVGASWRLLSRHRVSHRLLLACCFCCASQRHPRCHAHADSSES